MNFNGFEITPQSGDAGANEISISVAAVNEGIDKVVEIDAISGDKSARLTLIHEGMREVFSCSDGEFILADGGTLNVLKGEQEPEAIVVEYEGYYPELVDQLVARYGYNYGSGRLSPMPFDGNIILTGYANESVTGKVAYIHISDAGSRFCIFLYSETYKENYSCFCLSDSTENKGYCSVYAL